MLLTQVVNTFLSQLYFYLFFTETWQNILEPRLSCLNLDVCYVYRLACCQRLHKNPNQMYLLVILGPILSLSQNSLETRF